MFCFYPSSKCLPCSKDTDRINTKFFFEVLMQKSLGVKSIVIPIRDYIKKHAQWEHSVFLVGYVFLAFSCTSGSIESCAGH